MTSGPDVFRMVLQCSEGWQLILGLCSFVLLDSWNFCVGCARHHDACTFSSIDFYIGQMFCYSATLQCILQGTRGCSSLPSSVNEQRRDLCSQKSSGIVSSGLCKMVSEAMKAYINTYVFEYLKSSTAQFSCVYYGLCI